MNVQSPGMTKEVTIAAGVPFDVDQQERLEYAAALLDPWNAGVGVRLPGNSGAKATGTFTTVSVYNLACDDQGNLATVVRPGVWGTVASYKDPDNNGFGLDYAVDAFNDGFYFYGWGYPQAEAEAICKTAESVRQVSMGIELTYNGVVINASGIVVVAMHPPTRSFPNINPGRAGSFQLNTTTLATWTGARVFGIPELLAGDAANQGGGLRVAWLPFGNGASKFRPTGPDTGYLNFLTSEFPFSNGSVAAMPPPFVVGGATSQVYAKVLDTDISTVYYSLAPIDCDPDQFLGAVYGYLAAEIFVVAGGYTRAKTTSRSADVGTATWRARFSSPQNNVPFSNAIAVDDVASVVKHSVHIASGTAALSVDASLVADRAAGQSNAALLLNSVASFTMPDDVPGIWVIAQGLTPNDAAATAEMTLTVTTNWEFVPRTQTLMFDRPRTVKTSSANFERVVDAVAPIAATGHNVSTTKKPFLENLAGAISRGAGKVGDTFNRQVERIIGDAGTKFVEGAGDIASSLFRLLS